MKIKAFQGEVRVAKKTNDPLEPAVEGMNLIPSSLISTGLHSFCVTAIDQDNSFRIKQNTVVQISKLWEESQELNSQVIREVHLNLLQGNLLARLDKMPPNSKLSVQGPTAIAGASGTCFIVSADPENERTSVTVLDHEVSVESLNEPDKIIKAKKFQHIECAPWSKILISGSGRGILSESVKKEKNLPLNSEHIEIQARGKGKTIEEAKINSLSQLARIITLLPINEANDVFSLLLQDPILLERVFDAIAKAKTLDITKNLDETVQAQTGLDLSSLTQALNHPLFGIKESIIQVSREEYISRFGNSSLEVTQSAAEVEAYRNLGRIIYGTIVQSGMTIEGIADKDPTLRDAVQNVAKEAQIELIQYFSDGSIIANLNLRGNAIPERLSLITGNIYGQNYLSGAQLIEFNRYLEYPECQSTGEAYTPPTEPVFLPSGPEVTEEDVASQL